MQNYKPLDLNSIHSTPFNLNCSQIIVKKNSVSVPIKKVDQIPAPPSAQLLLSEVNSMWEEKKFCDLTISVEGTDIEVHRLILAGASPVFEAMLNSQMLEGSSKKIEIIDFDLSTFEEVLNYIYTRKDPAFKSFSTEHCLDILRAADKYALDNLVSLTVQYLISIMKINNVAEVLLIADQHSILNLKEAALKFICDKIVVESDFHFLEALGENLDLWKEITRKSLCKPKASN